MKQALIAGCGYVGRELAGLWAGAGWRVWGLKRHPSGLPDGVGSVAADVTDPASLRSNLPSALDSGLDVLVYALSSDRRTEALYRSAYVDGLSTLMEVLGGQDRLPGRLIFVSSTAVYEDVDGDRVDEVLPREPEGFRGRILREGERLAGSGFGGDVRGVVLRLGGIYGPGRTSMIEKVREGRALCPPGGPYFTNRIHRDDAARALAHLADLPDPDPVYLGVDRDPASYCEVVRWLSRAMGLPEPETGDDGSLGRRRRITKRCISDRLVESGFEFRYPSFRDGYGAVLREMELAVDGGTIVPSPKGGE